MQRFGVLIASVAYLGYVPVAPGTFGSAAGLVVYWAITRAGASSMVEVGLILLLFAIGVWSGTQAEHALGVDPSPVVLDEVVGMLVTLAFLPVSLAGAVVGFLVFRALDVLKPWPSNVMERWPGGLGIMADDVMAGVYGNLLMRACLWLTPVGWLA